PPIPAAGAGRELPDPGHRAGARELRSQGRARRSPRGLPSGAAVSIRQNLGRIDPATARYDRGYRVTAAFLAYLVERYDRDLVRQLNRALRQGRYEEGLFRQLTGKTVQALDEEWRATLRR